MNSKLKGNIGIGRAISYYTSIGWTVSLPITDSQSYDLIVDNNEVLYRVQVKYTTQKSKSGKYVVGIRSVSGSSRKVYKTVTKENADILFIVTDEFTMSVPTCDILCFNTITIDDTLLVKYQC